MSVQPQRIRPKGFAIAFLLFATALFGTVPAFADPAAKGGERILRFVSSCPRNAFSCGDDRWIDTFAAAADDEFDIVRAGMREPLFFETPADKLGGEQFDIASVQVSALGEIQPMIYGFQAPFGFDSMGHLYRVLHDPAVVGILHGVGERHGFHVLSAVPIGGFSGIFNNVRPVLSFSDVVDLRIRARDRLELGFLRDWGAIPIPVADTDLPNAVEHNVLDGFIAAPITAQSIDFSPSMVYFTDARVQVPIRFLIARSNWLDGLPPKARESVKRAAAAADNAVMAWISEETERALSAMVNKGVRVSRLDEDSREKLRALSQSAFTYLLHPDDSAVFIGAIERNRR